MLTDNLPKSRVGGGKIEEQDVVNALGYTPLAPSDVIVKNYGDIYITDIDEWVDTIEPEIVVSAHNTATLQDVSVSNQQYIFANIAGSRRYGWVLILSFTEIAFGTRFATEKFAFKKLNA